MVYLPTSVNTKCKCDYQVNQHQLPYQTILVMPRFKSRSTKIQPCSGNGLDSTMLFTKVMLPNLAVFGQVQSNDSSHQSYPELKLDSRKTSKIILNRMDEPEEVFEFSPMAASGFSRHRMSLPICSNTLRVTPGRFSSCRSSLDFSRHYRRPSGLMDEKTSGAHTCRDQIFEKFDVWKKMETRANESDMEPADNSNDIPCKNTKRISYSNTDREHSDISEWTANPEKCYRCILSFKQERSSDCTHRTNSHQPLVVHDLEDYQRVSLTPNMSVFSAVEKNLKDELEGILKNCKIDLNLFYNSEKLTPLHLAAKLGFTQCAQVLLKYGSNVNCLNSDNHSPLFLAFTRQHYECAILLIEAGADIQQFTAQKITEFRHAKKIIRTHKRKFVTDV